MNMTNSLYMSLYCRIRWHLVMREPDWTRSTSWSMLIVVPSYSEKTCAIWTYKDPHKLSRYWFWFHEYFLIRIFCSKEIKIWSCVKKICYRKKEKEKERLNTKVRKKDWIRKNKQQPDPGFEYCLKISNWYVI